MAIQENNMDNSIYEAAIEGLELQKQRIDEQIKQIREMLAGTGKPNKAAPAKASEKAGKRKKRRKLDDEAKLRISVAQKKRWATFREKQEKENG